jgi:hydrogenase/urease accessory protein HupE
MLKQIIFALICMGSFSALLHADEVRPAYLELKEKSPNVFSVLLKIPAKGDKKLTLHAQLPKHCKTLIDKHSVFRAAAYIERWHVKCDKGLIDTSIHIEGLENTNTDLLLRLEFLNATSQSVLLSPTNNSYTVAKVASAIQVIETYTWLGITHILLGFDHLLFVFALLLIVKNMRLLLWTITAFTLAHSITMLGATLGFMSMPQKPVEAIIALSILFLSMEIIREKQGKTGLTSRYPWLIAFIFGLLHGFGFAGALAEIGLPQQAITLALLFFNLGVELGQLLFVAGVVLLGWILQSLNHPSLLQRVETLVVYLIGGLSAFWVFERLSTF